MIIKWDLKNGRQLATVKAHTGPVNSLVVTADTLNLVSGSGDNSIRMWDEDSLNEKHCLFGHKDAVTSLAVSPDNMFVVSGSMDKTVRVWDLSEQAEIATFKETKPVRAVALSRDCKFLYTTHGRKAKQWNFVQKKFNEQTERDLTDYVEPGLFAYLFHEVFLAKSGPKTQLEKQRYALKVRRLNEYFFPIFPEFFSLIHFAAYYGNAEAVRALFGVNCLYAADMDHKTPLAYCLEMRHYECSDLIISHFKEHPQQLYVTY